MKNKSRLLVSLLTIIAFVLVLTNSCKKDDNNNNPTPPQTVTDIDGNVYHTITIGTQTWMVENLNVTHYRNGDAIANAKADSTWKLESGAYCCYNNNDSNSKPYGKLYNWYAVNTGNLCPTGWHVPTDAEWTILTNYLGGESVAGGKLKETGTTHWSSPNTGATNETGFTALPGGVRHSNGAFGYVGDYGYWWSATEYSANLVWIRYIGYYYSYVYRNSGIKEAGFSVRCIKD